MTITYYWIIFVALLIAIVLLDLKYFMLRDITDARPRPFSYGRVQLAWWTIIILSGFTAVIVSKGQIPTLDNSTLILLGISASTTAVSRLIDVPVQVPPALPVPEMKGQNFFIDILSEDGHVGMHRFQAVVFNVVLGVWFIAQVLHNLVDYPNICLPPTAVAHDCTDKAINFILPVITTNNLILLGLSSATYAALKTTEGKNV